MNHEEMSEQEINIHIAELNGIYWHIKPKDSKSGGWEYCKNHEILTANAGLESVELPDYYNNPSDAWPIMEEYKIGLTFVNGLWRASSVLAGYHEHSSKNAFRAAMIVYLNMKGEK